MSIDCFFVGGDLGEPIRQLAVAAVLLDHSGDAMRLFVVIPAEYPKLPNEFA